MEKEQLLEELGFEYNFMGKEGVDFSSWYEKEYKTKLGIFRLGIDRMDNKEYCIYYMTPDDHDTKLCLYSNKSLKKWDDYFTKMEKL